MWTALDNVVPLVAPNGRLFISIYNDQGKISRRWTSVKKAYNGLPPRYASWCCGPRRGICGGGRS